MQPFANAQTNEKEPAFLRPATLLVKQTEPFTLSGRGDNQAWSKTNWISLQKLDAGGPVNNTRFKILYAPTGIYVLFHGEDQKISTQYDTDFSNMFHGDVFEVFFHPDPKQPIYFEYEVNPLDKELVLLIPNINGMVQGWQPWHYKGGRKVIKKVHVEGGDAVMNGAIQSWSAELFFPFELLQPLIKAAPKSGTVWNANFYRLDYDTGKMIKWAWSPVEKSFHEYKRYGRIQFE